jgi:hypothetical protein
MPGGRILSAMGGYVNVISATNGQFARLDILVNDIERDIRVWRSGHSGTLTAIASRAVAYDWTMQAKLWWDIANPPEDLLGSFYGFGLQIGYGSLAAQQLYGLPLGQQQFYLAPSCILKRQKMHVNSTGAEDDGVVTADITIVGNSLLFLIPDTLAQYNTYVQQLQALGQFQGLPAFTTMQ